MTEKKIEDNLMSSTICVFVQNYGQLEMFAINSLCESKPNSLRKTLRFGLTNVEKSKCFEVENKYELNVSRIFSIFN